VSHRGAREEPSHEGGARTFHIRQATAMDLLRVRQSVVETAWQDLPPAQKSRYSRAEIESQVTHLFEDLLSRAELNHVVLLAETEEGTYMGHVWLGETTDAYTGARRGYIYDIYVSPAYRRKGVATEILHKAEQIARERGQREIGLTVAVHNERAQKFYARAGFHVERLLMSKAI